MGNTEAWEESGGSINDSLQGLINILCYEEFCRTHSGELIKYCLAVTVEICKLAKMKTTGGYIKKADSPCRCIILMGFLDKRSYITIIFIVEDLVIGNYSWRYNPYYLTFNNAFCFAGVFCLFANGYSFSCINQFCEISGCCMVWDAAHGNLIGIIFFVTGG